MNQLAPADVANHRCRFAYELYTYLSCRNYRLDCCLDEAIEAYRKFKLAQKDCELDDTTLCALANYRLATKEASCQTNVSCENQGTITIRGGSSTTVYTPTIINENFDALAPLFSAQPQVVLVPNSITQDAEITVGVIDQDYVIVDQDTFSTGSSKVGASVVVSPSYSMKLGMEQNIDNISALSGAYIQTIRIYYTDSIGQYVPNQFWDIDVSPTTPYRICGTCNPVAVPDLYLTSANWADSMKIMVDNAVRALTGAVNIDFSPAKYGNIDRVRFRSWVKHKPNSIWCGIQSSDMRVTYFDGVKSQTVTTTSDGYGLANGVGTMYGKLTYTSPCATTKDVEIANTQLTLPVQPYSNKFNEIVLYDTKTNGSVSIVSTTSISCTTSSYTASVTSNHVVTSPRWTNNEGVVIGTGYTISISTPGTYTFKATLDTGCVIEKSFTVS